MSDHKIYPRKRLTEIAFVAYTEGTTADQIIAAVRTGIRQGRKVMKQIEDDRRFYEDRMGHAAAQRYARKLSFGRKTRRTSRRR